MHTTSATPTTRTADNAGKVYSSNTVPKRPVVIDCNDMSMEEFMAPVVEMRNRPLTFSEWLQYIRAELKAMRRKTA